MQRSLLVTGGARGLGASVARAAAQRGYRVFVLDVDRDGAEAVAREVGGEAIVASIADTTTIERALDTLGAPDVLVNNAGIVRFGPLIDLDADDWRAVVEINLTGTFLLSQRVARRWIAAGTAGAIVNITSMNGVAPGPNAGAYGSTKAAIALLTQQMAIEWGPRGIRVNAVAPGLIDAGMSEPIYADPATRHARESKVPLGRLGVGDDIAHAVLFLASSEASYITGQNVLVDGGVTMSMIANLPRPKSVDRVGHTGD
jgi:NAD(P)-dependent dehydrogenase (short-subunit alcohol dehydrogenase family)